MNSNSIPPAIDAARIFTRSASLALQIEFALKSFYLAAISSRSESNSITSSPKSTQHWISEIGSWIAKISNGIFNNPLPFKLKSNQIPYLPKSSQQGFVQARHRSPYKSKSLQNLFILQRYIPETDPIRSQARQHPPSNDFQSMGRGFRKNLQ